jgi:hypothetical protein
MTKKSFIFLCMVTLVLSGSLCSKAQSINAFSLVNPPKQKLEYLPLGEIKPAGWMKNQMQNDLNGFVGHLDSLVPDLMADQIYGADRLTKSHKVKNLGNIGPELDPQYLWWNSETQSNWRDGYIRNAILLDNKKYLAKSEEYVNYILSTQDTDGYLGIYSSDLRYRFIDENGELWAKATVLRGLMAWYEYTGKSEIMAAIVKAVDNVMDNYPINASSPFKSSKPFAGGVTHGLMFTDILDRLYQLSGNKTYLDYALFLYKDFSLNILNEDAQYPKIINPIYKLKEHGAHTYEHLRPLVLAYYATGNPELKKAADIYLKHISNCTTPSGGPIGDEWIGERHADATNTGYEYCSLQELMDGYISLLQKSGDTHFGELAEHLFLNAAQGARLQEKSGIAYCKTDNSYQMKGTRNGEIQKGENQTRYKYSPAHQDVAVCCAPNAGRIMPYYIKSMWMKDSEGLVATLPGPCALNTTVKGVKIRISEDTEYPFSNTIKYQVLADKPVSFSLKIRKPAWANGFKLNCNFTEKEGYIIIIKTWNGNETVQLDLIAEPEITQDRNKENYFSYGGLVFALPVESKEVITKKYPVEGLNDLEYEPVNLILYRLSSSEEPETAVTHVDAPENVWNSIKLKTKLINSKTDTAENVELLPLGGTILRQETFPNEVYTSSGTIKRYNNFPSEFVNSRKVDVWLPDGYDVKKKYAVLYMHDGQTLFDSTTTWNHQEWGVDETIGRLIKEKKIKECIVVGIWNTPNRHSEYFPQKPFELLNPTEKDIVTKQLQSAGRSTEVFQPVSDNYLKFIVSELKPFIDKTYSTYTNKKNTFIAGSSMGGLISIYALCEYPGIFGGAACLSTHWPGTFTMENNPVPNALVSYLSENLPDPATHKIYFDYGDQTLDAMYPSLQKKVDEVMKVKGFTDKNWHTQFFPGKDHSEKSWNERLDIPVSFILGK